MPKTKHRERVLFRACLEAKQPFVLDKTNLTKDERAKVIQTVKEAKFRVVGYYFRASLEESLKRNAGREGKARIPDKGVHGSHSHLQLNCT